MNQWISAVNSYYYPQIVFHLSHERSVFPALGIEPDERVVQVALPKIERALDVMERELNDSRPFLVGDEVTLADLFMVPCMTSLARTEEGRTMLERRPQVSGWRERMEELASVKRFRAEQPPRKPIEHARRWVKTHRPGVLPCAAFFSVPRLSCLRTVKKGAETTKEQRFHEQLKEHCR